MFCLPVFNWFLWLGFGTKTSLLGLEKYHGLSSNKYAHLNTSGVEITTWRLCFIRHICTG